MRIFRLRLKKLKCKPSAQDAATRALSGLDQLDLVTVRVGHEGDDRAATGHQTGFACHVTAYGLDSDTGRMRAAEAQKQFNRLAGEYRTRAAHWRANPPHVRERRSVGAPSQSR